MVRCLLRGALTLFSCITCLLSSAFVLADKETEQTIAHALITKDDFLPLSPSVFFFSFLGCFSCRLLRPSPSTRENSNWTLETPGSLLRTCHLSFVQIMVRVTETALCLFILLRFFFCVSSSCFIKFAGETEGEGNRQPETRRKKKKRRKPTVNYECGRMIKNEPFKNPICHGGVRWEMSEGQSMYCRSLWMLTNTNLFISRVDRWKARERESDF